MTQTTKTNRMRTVELYTSAKQGFRYGYIVRFRDNKEEEVSTLFKSKEEAMLESHLMLDEKMDQKDNDYLGNIKEFAFFEITGVLDRTNGEISIDIDNYETLVFGNGFKPIE